jgi:hypothetical protein
MNIPTKFFDLKRYLHLPNLLVIADWYFWMDQSFVHGIDINISIFTCIKVVS